MAWTPKVGKLTLDWIESKILLMYVDDLEIPEQLYVLCQWRKKNKAIKEQWTFSLMYLGQRIYAIDLEHDFLHTNNAGKGRPLYGQEVEGPHEHTWSADGYGYAEPIRVPWDTPEIIWKMFLKRAGIVPDDFFHPDNNQPELDL